MPATKNKVTIEQTKINLAPKDPFFESILGKVTTWALAIGRYLVIFTELVVIVSFLSRFQLDRQVTDLNSEILKQQRIIESYGDLEQNVRDVQRKIETYNQLKAKLPMKDVFNALTAITPADVTYAELTIQDGGVIVKAHANSYQALSRYVTNFQASSFFSNVVSDNISNKDAGTQGYDVQLSAKIKSIVQEPESPKTLQLKNVPNQ